MLLAFMPVGCISIYKYNMMLLRSFQNTICQSCGIFLGQISISKDVIVKHGTLLLVNLYVLHYFNSFLQKSENNKTTFLEMRNIINENMF